MKYLFLLFALIQAAQADDDAIEKYKDYTPEQIAALPEKTRESEVPMVYTFAAQSALSEGSQLVFAAQLNTLMYPGVHNYPAAIRAFQKDLGDKPTGVLTVWQIYNLEQLSDLQRLGKVYFPSIFYSHIDNDYASVNGTFKILDDRIAYPVNYTEFECFRSDGYCRMEQMFINFPDDESWGKNYHVQKFDSTYYTITNWTENTIDAVPRNAGNVCRTTTLNFNFSTKEFYEIARNTEKDCEVLGVDIGKLGKPRISQIVDGTKIYSEEFRRIRKSAYDVWSSDFRQKLDKYLD